MQKKIFIFVLTLFVATCFAAETEKKASSEKDAEKTGEKDQSKVEYWVIRSQALTELTPAVWFSCCTQFLDLFYVAAGLRQS